MKTATRMRPDLEPLPHRMTMLPVDERGYPVPWFVGWVNGKPEFRVADAAKLRDALRFKLCWVCGEKMGRFSTFVVGPMCGINRTSAEPPSHLDCAEWSARNCPFLSNAGRRRREDETINNESFKANSPGIALTRNPGVTLLWTTRDYRKFSDGAGGLLLRMGDPVAVRFYANGRKATAEEIAASVESGIPSLREVAEQQGDEALAHLAEVRKQFDAVVSKFV
jgi:hypothetical protein